MNGGSLYLSSVLNAPYEEIGEISNVREYINNSFENISCALLPYPGSAVSSNSGRNIINYDGNHHAMDIDFKNELKGIIENILHHDSLVIKKINNKTVTGAEFKIYVKSYLKLYNQKLLPKTQTIYMTTVEKQLGIVVNQCLDEYKIMMHMHTSNGTNESNRTQIHRNIKEFACELFTKKQKMGTGKIITQFKNELEKAVEKSYVEMFQISNETLINRQKEIERVQSLIEYTNSLENQSRVNYEKYEIANNDLMNLNETIKKAMPDYDQKTKLVIQRLERELENLKNYKVIREERLRGWFGMIGYNFGKLIDALVGTSLYYWN